MDIRGIPLSPIFGLGRLVANAPAPAGFTAGEHYPPLGYGLDNSAAPPTSYVLTINDQGQLNAQAAAAFTFELPNGYYGDLA